jgi:DNA-binding CsgD family transcriptional regulator
MPRVKLSRALAATVAAVAVLNTLSALSMPVPERRTPLVLILIWLVLLLLHAAAYHFEERLSLRTYASIQAALLFAIAVSRPPMPVTIGVYMACTAELVVLAGAQWGSIRITLGAIGLLVLALLITSNLYFAATAGLILAITGLVAHALAGLFRRPATPLPETSPPPLAPPTPNGAGSLSPREIDILRELVSGARNSAIAQKLGISERTVKSHLGSIYQKLGVDTRAGAVAAAVQRKLV